ncbi:MAG: acireductone synthase [Gammaproteobacteria bacterium]
MIKAIITDIEGTTTSLTFVKDVLFPFARAHLADFIRYHENDPQVERLLDDVRREMGACPGHGAGSVELVQTARIIEQLIRWMDEDKKITPLKTLQGLIWQEGYDLGAFYGHVYRDAADNLKAWKARGLKLYVYSSGSTHAQRLLFSHTEYGDLTAVFSDYFDTRVGGKKEPESYRKIAERLRCSEDSLLFLSDSKDELDAAGTAGLDTVWVCREADPDPNAMHLQVRSFDEISIGL